MGCSGWRRDGTRDREQKEEKLERDVLKGITGMSPWSLSHACFLSHWF